MVFSRIARHFRNQDWAAFVVEFVIVVLGVFIGIQASNWNQARADARLGRDYAKRLAHDLDQDRAGLRAQIEYYSAVLESVRKTDALLREPDADPRELVINAYRATEVDYVPMMRATWDQIVSSGHLGLLPTAAVESGLSQYYAFDTAQDIYHMGLDSAYRRSVRETIPLDMQVAIHATCSDVRDARGNIVGFTDHCEFKADPIALETVAAALRSNLRVAASLRYQYSFAVNARLNLRTIKITLENALVALGVKPEASGRTAPGPAPASASIPR